ncbi:MAG: DUF4743 domain-containing protein [Burkholderiales bacterium]|nr:DUF4743 domain-containing protein [Burkholderiales bacterium]
MRSWHALGAATLARVPRLPFAIDARRVGSIAAAHLPALRRLDREGALRFDAAGVELATPAAQRDAAFATLNVRLREDGLIRAWRDEIFPVVDPATLETLARFERAAARFWGTLTFGAHATGFVAGPDGRPQALWIARRSLTKATDPGLYDNLIGGGVPAGQSPAQALVREAFEEAGLLPQQLQAVRPTGILRLARDLAEGFQHEWLHAYELELPPGLQPRNQDGEVDSFHLLAPTAALEIAAGPGMTVDAALVTIDFALRHRLVQDEAARRAIDALRVATPA